jgi:hypothetical protein
VVVGFHFAELFIGRCQIGAGSGQRATNVEKGLDAIRSRDPGCRRHIRLLWAEPVVDLLAGIDGTVEWAHDHQSHHDRKGDREHYERTATDRGLFQATLCLVFHTASDSERPLP